MLGDRIESFLRGRGLWKLSRGRWGETFELHFGQDKESTFAYCGRLLVLQELAMNFE